MKVKKGYIKTEVCLTNQLVSKHMYTILIITILYVFMYTYENTHTIIF